MIITDHAKEYIQEAMEANDVHTLRLSFEGMEDGMALWGIQLDEPQDDDILEVVNGVQVAIAKQVEEVAKQVKLDFEENTLVILGIDD